MRRGISLPSARDGALAGSLARSGWVGRGLARFRLGAPLLTPNRKEFAEAARSRADSEKSIADAAQDAMHLADCDAILVPLSERGMTLVPRHGEAIHVPAHPVKVRDVSGAGDTVAA